MEDVGTGEVYGKGGVAEEVRAGEGEEAEKGGGGGGAGGEKGGADEERGGDWRRR